MTDGVGFTLTPVDVRAHEFRRAMRGYDPAGVDEFRSRVAEELERLLRERAVLDERLQSFREQLKAFRDREKALNDALVVAQQLKTDAQEAAKREADLVLKEARLEGERLVAEARNVEAKVRRDIETSQRQLGAYLTAWRGLLERHLSEVDALETHERDGSPPR